MTSFEWPVRVYIEDTDAGGIVYYVNYFKFMERARTELFRSLDFGKTHIFNDALMFVVHSLNSQYLVPARLDDQLITTTKPIKCGKAFVLLQQNIYRLSTISKNNSDYSKSTGNEESQNNNRELLCRSEVKIACVDRVTIKARRMPEVMISALEEMMA